MKKFIPLMLMLIASICAAVIVILTITNVNYLIETSGSYFIPYIVMFVFTIISVATFGLFVKLWNDMFA